MLVSKFIRYLSLSILGLGLSLSTVSSVQAKELIIERTFSISKFKVPPQCELDIFKSTCTRLVNYYARRFEREMVSHFNFMLDQQQNDAGLQILLNNRNRERSLQEVSMVLYSRLGDEIITLYSIFQQHIVGNTAPTLLVETMNFDAQTGKLIRFEQLFENPALAAMLCARAIEAKYREYRSPLLPVVISATELSPSNFIITPQGLRFFFPPNLVKPNTSKADSFLVRLEALKQANPVERWWQAKQNQVTITDAEKKSLANSRLASIIHLEEEEQVSQKLQQASSEQDARFAAEKIKGREETEADSGTREKQELRVSAQPRKQESH